MTLKILKKKCSILEKMLVNQMKWSYTNKCDKEGAKIAREIIRKEVKRELSNKP